MEFQLILFVLLLALVAALLVFIVSTGHAAALAGIAIPTGYTLPENSFRTVWTQLTARKSMLLRRSCKDVGPKTEPIEAARFGRSQNIGVFSTVESVVKRNT